MKYFAISCTKCENIVPHSKLVYRDYKTEGRIKKKLKGDEYDDYYITDLYKE